MTYLDTIASYLLVFSLLLPCAYATGWEWMVLAGWSFLTASLVIKYISYHLHQIKEENAKP